MKRQIKTYFFLLLSLLYGFIVPSTWAQQDFRLSEDDTPFPIIRPLNWLNSSYLEKQRRTIDNLARREIGRQTHGNKSDIATLQRIVNRSLIEADNKEHLQALGVVLGDIYVDEYRFLLWMVYEDEQGPSHAVCLKDTEHCLFPVTMLSRRLAVGLKPQVIDIYNKGLNLMKPHFPHIPFSGN